MDAVEWSDEEHQVPENANPDLWQRSDTLPEPGQTRVVQVRFPFHEALGSEFQTFYQPALSSLNGWEEHPEEIDRSAFVRCRSEEVLERWESGAWIRVAVSEVLLTGALCNAIPATRGPLSFMDRIRDLAKHTTLWTWGSWSYYSANVQGDLGQWLLVDRSKSLMDAAEPPRLVAFGEWAFHVDSAYACNHELDPNALTGAC